jgi:hypothetical protein
MATLNPAPPAVAEDAPTLDGLRVSHMAATLLRKRYTSEDVREHAAGRPQFAYMWDAIADSMDAITAESVPAQRAAPARGAAPA